MRPVSHGLDSLLLSLFISAPDKGNMSGLTAVFKSQSLWHRVMTSFRGHKKEANDIIIPNMQHLAPHPPSRFHILFPGFCDGKLLNKLPS